RRSSDLRLQHVSIVGWETHNFGAHSRDGVKTIMTNGNQKKVAILGGNRIPFARSNKEYADASNQDMLTAAIEGLVARYGLQDEELGLVTGGAVLRHCRDSNIVREVVLGSSLPNSTPAMDLRMACGTGLAAIVAVGDAIRAGRIESGIGSGVDTTSD